MSHGSDLHYTLFFCDCQTIIYLTGICSVAFRALSCDFTFTVVDADVMSVDAPAFIMLDNDVISAVGAADSFCGCAHLVYFGRRFRSSGPPRSASLNSFATERGGHRFFIRFGEWAHAAMKRACFAVLLGISNSFVRRRFSVSRPTYSPDGLPEVV